MRRPGVMSDPTPAHLAARCMANCRRWAGPPRCSFRPSLGADLPWDSPPPRPLVGSSSAAPSLAVAAVDSGFEIAEKAGGKG